MQVREAVAILSQIRTDLVVGQVSVTIPVEIVDSVLSVWSSGENEFAREAAATVMELRSTDPTTRKAIPLSAYIEGITRCGGRVFRRRVIEIEGWTQVVEGTRDDETHS